jgi:hypothetical protein
MIDVRWLPDEHGEMNGGFIARRFARWNDYAQLWMTGKDRWVSGPRLYTGRRAEAVPVAAPVAAFTQGDLDEYGPSLVTVPVHPAVHAIERMHASRPRDGRPQLYIP